jgi:hypothetical protein
MRRALACLATLAASSVLACGGDRGRSPLCGLAQAVGPSIIQDRLRAHAFLTDAPRGLPGLLPVRIVGDSQQSDVQVGYSDRSAGGQLVLSYRGPDFPARYVNDTMSYGILVVDDTSERAMGIIVYQTRRPPADYPRVGTMEGAGALIPVYGVRVNWAGTSNPRCPLLGTAASAKKP